MELIVDSRLRALGVSQSGPGCAQPSSSANLWGHHATASREKVRFEVRCVRSKRGTAKQAPNQQDAHSAHCTLGAFPGPEASTWR